MKVLGCKVRDQLYDDFAALPGNLSDNLREAVELYIKHSNEPMLTTVNQRMFEDKYTELCKRIDKHLDTTEGF